MQDTAYLNENGEGVFVESNLIGELPEFNGCMIDTVLAVPSITCGDTAVVYELFLIRDGVDTVFRCSDTIWVLDTLPPVIDMIGMEVAVNEDCMAIMPDLSGYVSDNCALDTIIQTPEAGSPLGAPGSMVMVTLMAVDSSGNENSIAFDFEVIEVAPTLPLNCVRVISPSILSDGTISVTISEISPQATCLPVHEVSVLNQWGGLIWKGSGMRNNDFILEDVNLCSFQGQSLEIVISNGISTCRMTLHLDRNAPLAMTSAFGTTVTEAADLDIPTAYIDEGLLVTYCGYVPDPEDHRPQVTEPCQSIDRSRGQAFDVQVQPDWIEILHCTEASDTSKIIYRTWEVFNKAGELFTLTDTIVVLRLPALTASNFVGYSEDSVYCEITPQVKSGESQKRYSAWKQPVGLHDYELPNAKIGGVVYEIPLTIIIAGVELADAQGAATLAEYLNCVIVRKAGGGEVTVGDIISGDYLSDLLSSVSTPRLGYGFLHAIYKLGESPVSIIGGLFSFYPYLLLEQGDWVLSEGGNYEEVTKDWFYNGNGNAPYWFTGGWPFISAGDAGVWYSDRHLEAESGVCSVRVLLPALEAESETCVEVCLDALSGHAHCGIVIEYEDSEWTGQCPLTSGRDIVVRQTCWGTTENECISDEYAATEGGDGFVVAEENLTDKARTFRLSQWLSHVDTIGPIFDFEYPLGICDEEEPNGQEGEMGPTGPMGPGGGGGFFGNLARVQSRSPLLDGECSDLEWCKVDIETAIRAGQQYASANAWERCHPTVYRVSSRECSAEVLVPDVQLIDNCSGVHTVKAMVEVAGGTRTVALKQTGVEYRILENGDTSFVYTYSHLTNPIRIPFNGCDGPLTEVRYEAADHCWNQSEWYKYIRVIDDIPPTVIANRDINVSLTSETVWVGAETFDEGSWDNCALDLKLARRSDWLACIDICPEADEHESHDNWIDILEDLGFDRGDVAQAATGVSVGAMSVNANYNPDDLAVMLSGDKVEEYFFHQIVWLWEDGQASGRKVVHGWLFALAAYIAENCSEADEHGNNLNVRDLEYLFDHLFGQPGYGNEIALLGGGWAQDVPFKCIDVCDEVTTELLVLDACYNWGTAWSTAYVEDKTTSRVLKPLVDIDLSCEAYNTFYKDLIESAAALGANGSAQDSTGLFAVLDSAFGTYESFSPDELNFSYFNITCREKSETDQIADTAHDGTIHWINRVTKTTVLDTAQQNGVNGILDIVCSADIVQDVWIDLDECGNGTITRRFYLSGGCATTSVPFVLEQVMRVGSACSLRESMFDLPPNVGTSSSPICLSQPLSTAYFPELLGSVSLKPHLSEVLCNSIAIGRDVKELNALGQMGLKKYQITWTMKDWCEGSLGELYYRQEVMAVIDPTCEGTNGVVSGKVNPHVLGTTKPVFRENFVLYQNRPNPFEGYTVIGFELPADMEARMTIYDVMGRAIKEIKGSYHKGYHEVQILESDLPVGVFYYQLDTDHYTATKKMIKASVK